MSYETAKQRETAIVVHPYDVSALGLRKPVAALEEAVGLTAAIRLDIIYSELVPLRKIRPSTLIGKGKIQELSAIAEQHHVSVIIIDHALSPLQQRNLERELKCKVIDRTALILEIFGERAQTAEGKLQVELAALEYQKSRLVRSWTHLERQRGGAGFMGGPGEKQIETDRRIIRDKIQSLKKQLEKVVRTRDLHRKHRDDVPYPTVALTGYTNAGKSTLFNRLTDASVMAEDQLFATLDPTIRKITLPSGLEVLLSDTVGFIADLPTELVAAFRATLEEVCGANLILHIRDISHEDTDAQKADVETVLKDLFAKDDMPPLVEVWNKIDVLQKSSNTNLSHGERSESMIPGERANLESNHTSPLSNPLRIDLVSPNGRDAYCVSALTGEGCDALIGTIDQLISEQFYQELTITLPASDGKRLAWLYAHGNVSSTHTVGDTIEINVQLSPANAARFGSVS